MPAKRDHDRDIDSRITGRHEIKKGEQHCRMKLEKSGGYMWCLMPGCAFHIHVAAAPVPVMMAELRDFYTQHRKHRHPELYGRTGYDYQLGDEWTVQEIEKENTSQLNRSQG